MAAAPEDAPAAEEPTTSIGRLASGPILTLGSQASGESAHQING
jgi:hypothetical protein